MSTGRHSVVTTTAGTVVVLNGSVKKWLKAESRENQAKFELVSIKIAGGISRELAITWAQQIADQLNENDSAAVARARLTG